MAKFLAKKGENRFLGGDFPSVADVEAYGVINLTENTSAFPEYEKNPAFFQWYKSVEQYVNTHQGMVIEDDTPEENITSTTPLLEITEDDSIKENIASTTLLLQVIEDDSGGKNIASATPLLDIIEDDSSEENITSTTPLLESSIVLSPIESEEVIKQ